MRRVHPEPRSELIRQVVQGDGVSVHRRAILREGGHRVAQRLKCYYSSATYEVCEITSGRAKSSHPPVKHLVPERLSDVRELAREQQDSAAGA